MSVSTGSLPLLLSFTLVLVRELFLTREQTSSVPFGSQDTGLDGNG